MKLGAEGFIAYDKLDSLREISQPFPALSVNPLDVSGAGDSILAVMSLGLSSEEPMMLTSALAACVASIAVETMGNKSITSIQLKEKLDEIFDL